MNTRAIIRRMIDRAAARLDHINNAAMTYADIAGQYAFRRRGAHEGWTQKRAQRATLLQQKATEKSVYCQSELLAACNRRHLALAQTLEQAVNHRLERAAQLSENALSEAAQRISGLALGVSTENLHTSHDS